MHQENDLQRLADAIERRLHHKENALEPLQPDFWATKATTDVCHVPTFYLPSLCVLVQGEKQVHFQGKVLTYNRGHYIMPTLTVPVRYEVFGASRERPLLGLSIPLDFRCISQLLVEMGQENARPGEPEDRDALATHPLTPSLLSVLRRMIDVAQDATDWKVLGPGLQRELHYLLLQGPAGGRLRARISAQGKLEQVSRAVHFITERFTSSLDIETIAKHAGLSASGLHARFKEATGHSPMQFVKQLRLEQARSLLLEGQSVTDVALEVGYVSPSQFSREFSRHYGSPPSRARTQILPPPVPGFGS